MVRTADVDEGQGVGAVEELVGHAAVGHGLPHEQRSGVGAVGGGGLGLAAGQDVGDEVPTAGRRADEVEDAGLEQGTRQVVGGETLFGGQVAEGAALGAVDVAVPAAGGETVRGGSDDGAGRPAVDQVGDGGGEVGPLIDDPSHGPAEWRWGEQSGPEGGPGASAAEDITDRRPGRREFNIV